jgi:hypothetical protein
MISKTEMLEALNLVDYRITEVLHSWTKHEGNNLEGFINNPSGHVNYNPYIILDFSKLQTRLDMLRYVEKCLLTVTEYKKGNPDYTKSMYENAIDGVHVQLIDRLLDWLKTRFADMTAMSGNAQAPLDDYKGMYTFNFEKFKEEYDMYANAIEGIAIVAQYKKEQMEKDSISLNTTNEELITTNEPPSSGNTGA